MQETERQRESETKREKKDREIETERMTEISKSRDIEREREIKIERGTETDKIHLRQTYRNECLTFNYIISIQTDRLNLLINLLLQKKNKKFN